MRRKKTACILLAAMMASSCAALAGCDSLVTKNNSKDYLQVVAEVDLAKSDDFQGDGAFASVKDVVGKKEIVKRDLIATYIANGYSVQSQYGWSYLDTFNMIVDSLVNREVFVQYAKAYLMKNYAAEEKYTVDGYKAAISGDFKTEAARSAAGLAYFLSDDEKAAADYELRVTFNNSLDSIEEGIIKLNEDDTDSSTETVRTLPTDAETENDDYYDPDYRIYTGKETALGTYEKVEGSTAATRKKAYAQFLSNLRANDLLEKGENTDDFESTNYFASEKETAYASAVVDKCIEKFEDEAEKELNETWANKLFADTVASQRESYTMDKSSFETALDSMSNTSFVLSAPQSDSGSGAVNDAYGFVINILLPFSETQKQALTDSSKDLADTKGGKYAARAALLEQLTATDQRGTWFTGDEDYSFEGGSDAYKGTSSDRKYLFFENSTASTAGKDGRYKKLPNYYGKYTYNGKVEKIGDEYKLTSAKITIDDFLTEMKEYLATAGLEVNVTKAAAPAEYYKQTQYYYTGDERKDEVNYENFVYEAGKLAAFDTGNGGTAFNANEMFVEGTPENKAFSVMNELSFAYNTDTAGLNKYLGYAVSPYKTDYMAEFEYAAQEAVKGGAGSYAVVPTDYGWHIIYCTFSFADAESPFSFDYSKRHDEGTFSYYYFEQLKSTSVSSGATNKRTDAINRYVEACSTRYEKRYADLTGLDNA